MSTTSGNKNTPHVIHNAKILDTFLGIEDHGLFTWAITFSYGDGSVQGSGHRVLAMPPNYKREEWTHTSDLAGQTILRVVQALDVESWEKLPGTLCRVRRRPGGDIAAIGHYMRDHWFDYEKLSENYTAGEGPGTTPSDDGPLGLD